MKVTIIATGATEDIVPVSYRACCLEMAEILAASAIAVHKTKDESLLCIGEMRRIRSCPFCGKSITIISATHPFGCCKDWKPGRFNQMIGK